MSPFSPNFVAMKPATYKTFKQLRDEERQSISWWTIVLIWLLGMIVTLCLMIGLRLAFDWIIKV